MRLSKILIAADFETTVYEGQTETEVWSAAYAELFNDKVCVLNSISQFIDDLIAYKQNVTCWFHNVRFDGSFIVDYLFRKGFEWTKEKPKNKQFSTLISDMNRWYTLTVNVNGNFIEFRDSSKLFPMTLKEAGEAFKTVHRKLEMEYKGFRYSGCRISKEEMQYIINDVLCLKECLEFMLKEGHTKLTIGSCCVSEFRSGFSKKEFNALFPRLDTFFLKEKYGALTADEYVRKSYKGAFCYVKPDIAGKKVGKGRTFDTNSLYPFVQHSDSGNRYPIGKPKFWSGNFIPDEASTNERLYFLRFSCSFELRERMLPTLQIKGDYRYKSNEWLTTSRVKYRGEYYDEWNGEKVRPVITMTKMDFELFKEHYEISDLRIYDGCFFDTGFGFMDFYLDKYKKQKETSTGGKRTEAKLFSNNLYGKFATSPNANYKVPVMNNLKDCVDLIMEEDAPKETFYIPIGSCITSYARCYTIRHAQANYDLFCYADTDSLHLLDGYTVDIEEHPTKYGAWKKEAEWCEAVFLRQKTYIERLTESGGKAVYPCEPFEECGVSYTARDSDGNPLDKFNVVAAGMPKNCKKDFCKEYDIDDFKVGLSLYGKLTPKRIKGGTILEEGFFTIR